MFFYFIFKFITTAKVYFNFSKPFLKMRHFSFRGRFSKLGDDFTLADIKVGSYRKNPSGNKGRRADKPNSESSFICFIVIRSCNLAKT